MYISMTAKRLDDPLFSFWLENETCVEQIQTSMISFEQIYSHIDIQIVYHIGRLSIK